MELKKNNIGENIKYYRQLKGMKQSELAKAVGITATTLSKLEYGSGSIKLDTLSEIAKVLGVMPERLLFSPDSMVLNSDVLKKIKEEVEKPLTY